MKINLVDDTALIETTFTRIKNAPKKERTALGVRENLQTQEPGGTNASICNGLAEKIKTSIGFGENCKTQESRGKMRLNKISLIGYRPNGSGEEKKSLLGVCGNVKMNQNTVANGCGKKKVILSFAENVKIQENDKCIGDGRKLDGFPGRQNENVGFLEFNKIQENASSRKCLNGVENSCGNEKGILGFGTNQEKNGKKIQMWVARGEVKNKHETTFKDETVSPIEMVEVQSENGGGKKNGGTKICYSREEMEALRFVNEEEQKKKWGGICCELGPVVKREYDGLLDCNNHQQQPGLNIYHQLDFRKRVTTRGIFGPMAANGRGNH